MEKIEWQSPFEKESHPNKCLYCHIDETKRIFKKFCEFYRIKDEKILEIIEKVVEYHDAGKLNKQWRWDSKTIPHSNYSVIKYMESIEKREKTNYDSLIAFLILKHHSSLSPSTPFKEFENLMESFKILRRDKSGLRDWLFEEFPFERRILLADVYGFFKLADCLSASSYTYFLPEKPQISEESLKSFLKDEKRRSEQMILSKIGRFGILRAPTGWGKTKASPYFGLGKDLSKIFFIFPTITAINKLFKEFSTLLENKIDKYFYFYEVELSERTNESEELQRRIFISRHFLKPYIITTIDQFLLTFLQVGGYHFKRCMFRNSAIIVDEVHLLNEKMLVLLLHFLKKFKEIYNLNVLFMSATLPTALKETIESEIEEKISPLNEDLLKKLSERYKELKRIKFELRLENYLEEAIEEIVEKAKNSKVLVLCNTVEYAVKIYSMIKESGYKGKVLLLHSRFIYKKRKKKEEEIENLKKQPHILISTQVCEVSLDISYDYLFTELAPVASLVQRFGRVNRYEKETHLTNVFIFKPFLRDEKYYPYEERELEIAEKCVWEIKELKNEFQLLQKIDEVIDKQTIQKQIDKAKNELEIQTTFETPTRTGYFFSLDLSEDDVRKLIEYRENFTTLIIPFGELISDGEEALVLREKINELYKEYEKRVDKKENLLLVLSQLKGFTVPVPFYSVIRANFMKIGLPLLTSVKDFIYHTEYGFVKQEIIGRIE